MKHLPPLADVLSRYYFASVDTFGSLSLKGNDVLLWSHNQPNTTTTTIQSINPTRSSVNATEYMRQPFHSHILWHTKQTPNAALHKLLNYDCFRSLLATKSQLLLLYDEDDILLLDVYELNCKCTIYGRGYFIARAHQGLISTE